MIPIKMTPQPLPRLKPREVDMSPEAIDQRRDCSDLTFLSLMLASAKQQGTVQEGSETRTAGSPE